MEEEFSWWCFRRTCCFFSSSDELDAFCDFCGFDELDAFSVWCHCHALTHLILYYMQRYMLYKLLHVHTIGGGQLFNFTRFLAPWWVDLTITITSLYVRTHTHQSVTNIFEYSNIRIYWSRIYIRTFVRINFSFTNIFGHSFVSNLFVRIYSDIRWWVC